VLHPGYNLNGNNRDAGDLTVKKILCQSFDNVFKLTRNNAGNFTHSSLAGILPVPFFGNYPGNQFALSLSIEN